MARDRKRAKQRRDRARTAPVRQGGTSARGDGADHGVPPSQPARADVPGALDHASGEVDEFDAALVRGAGGVPVEPEADEAGAPIGEDELQTPAGLEAGREEAGARVSGAPLRGGNRVVGFLRASWAELQRVQWPDRRQVSQATAVVLGFVAIAGAYLGLADFVAKEIVEFIL